ncbi:MAG: hypothetical protein H6760_00445 [Candidatus Nomurabacteria bacterium]|nr:MAG: hypothetical protein H6760_00445 [Candidatus Nomurabacteria bacterium]
MDDELKKRLDDQDALLKAIYQSTEKTRKYFLWSLVANLLLFLLPLIGVLLLLPVLIQSLDLNI